MKYLTLILTAGIILFAGLGLRFIDRIEDLESQVANYENNYINVPLEDFYNQNSYEDVYAIEGKGYYVSISRERKADNREDGVYDTASISYCPTWTYAQAICKSN